MSWLRHPFSIVDLMIAQIVCAQTKWQEKYFVRSVKTAAAFPAAT
ncbi:hypothetical protein X751_17485 [Mesorhizobium sp. LNJC395A00]|nr:hypothetical protein X751_17485 [Mesorhizobium sp. LNJC395A00]